MATQISLYRALDLSGGNAGTVVELEANSATLYNGANHFLQEKPLSLPVQVACIGSDSETLDNATLLLGVGDIKEIEVALDGFKNLELDGDEADETNFPLPTLSPRLKQFALSLHNNNGFFLLRGLDSKKYTAEDNLVIFLGISSHVANERGVQDKRGNVVVHVTDNKLWTVPHDKRHGIHSNKSMPFHNDMGSDILALQVRESAYEGGYTYISPVNKIHQDLLESNPQTLERLMTPNWPIQVSGKKPSYILCPLLQVHEGHVMASLDPGRLGPHARDGSDSSVPALTAEQLGALATLDAVATKHRIAVRPRPGDVLYIHNWAALHARDAYRDGADSSRHLVRMWLRSSDLGWAVPDAMRVPWEAAFRPGTAVPARLYSVVPAPEYKVPKYTAGSAAFVIEDGDQV